MTMLMTACLALIFSALFFALVGGMMGLVWLLAWYLELHASHEIPANRTPGSYETMPELIWDTAMWI